VPPLVVGILVGGKGSRLGGVAKGMLLGPDRVPLIERLLSEVRSAAPNAEIYLLGSRPEYAHLPVHNLTDTPAEIGPLGGLRALLLTGAEEAVLLGCDMPFVSARLLTRLLSSTCDTAISAQFEAKYFEPLFSRFNVAQALPVVDELIAQKRYSLQGLLLSLDARGLYVSPEEAAQLRDWDTPEDVMAG
jgi:molybdenum cofactor guanylyltransferase